MEKVRAYHFVGKTLRDGRPVPKDGELLVHSGEVVLCEKGLHASEHPFDALQYAPGNTLCLVDVCGDPLRRGDDKVAGKERTIIARVDVEDLMRDFARRCALDVVHLWSAPQVVLDYLHTGDPGLQAAAMDAARAAAGDAARAAAGAAARDAARDAARAAARAAAWAAAGAAAWAAAWDAQRKRFEDMVSEALSHARY